MQTCPECDSAMRDGARFCTSCGHRFPYEDETGAWAAADPTSGSQDWSAPSTPDDEVARESWPSVPVSSESPATVQPNPVSASPGSPNEPPPPDQNFAGFWPESGPDAWPTAPPSSPTLGARTDALYPWIDTPTDQPSVLGAGNDTNQTQALELLTQLRAAILAIEPGSAVDLQSVISDLEVAATPPGAVAPDDLAELREAIYAARENPRDIETIVALTRRMDALAALVIAYDRAIAAIERSLAALKPANHVEATDQTSPAPD